MASRIDNVAVFVGDLTRLEHFYTEVLGLTVRARVTTPTVHEVIVGGADGDGSALMLSSRRTSPSTSPSTSASTSASTSTQPPIPPPPTPTGLWKVFVRVDDLSATLGRAAAAGAPTVMERTRLDQYGLTIAMIGDPDGHVVELGQFDG